MNVRFSEVTQHEPSRMSGIKCGCETMNQSSRLETLS